jgi:hypothetical protein
LFIKNSYVFDVEVLLNIRGAQDPLGQKILLILEKGCLKKKIQ